MKKLFFWQVILCQFRQPFDSGIDIQAQIAANALFAFLTQVSESDI
ncbi:hypothetical protein ID858_14915 [Xenorhabdus sp. DI]|nr:MULTISPECIES: hypothetical protein [unclassified Xenorhabdus]MBD2783535.1 hypothetical protein [Xenorhabdus sp. 3]MBD2789792.1 hypothetical protein [Xenorhabdus sp. DI]